ncbi:MAG TPA: hypothetical protein VFN07_01055 [Trueperaceae bacterium]|nr:hypothetical protein [Trueperaceae bacterium]
MAKWTSKPIATTFADNDVVLLADVSEPAGTQDRRATLAALRTFLGAGITVGVTQASHGLSVGDVVRFDGTSYVQATADTAGNAEAVGVVTAVPDSGTFAYQTAGVASTLSGLTPGELYHLKDDGSLGTSAGTVDKPVLIATSATTAVLILAISGAGGGGSDPTRIPKLAVVRAYGTSASLDEDDDLAAYVRVTAAATITLPDGFPAGWQCVLVNATDSDTVELDAATTLTLPAGFEPEIQNRRAVTVIHVGSNVWEAHGALVETP